MSKYATTAHNHDGSYASKSEAIKSITRNGTTFTATRTNNTTFTFNQQDNNTTYTGANGISLSGTTFSNSGVRSVSTGGTNGTISVNTNGTAANVAVKGLGNCAYASSASFALKTIGFENKTAHGVQIRKYTTDLFIYITVVGTATSTCTNEVVYSLTSLQSQDNAVVPLTSYDDVNVHKGRLMYNEGKIKITISNASYMQGYLIIPNR